MSACRTAGASRAETRRQSRVGPSRSPRHFTLAFIVGTLSLAGTPGCSLTPTGTKEEQSRLEEAGGPYEPPIEARMLPELPAAPTWRDVLHRAFLVNGDLEAAYFEWKAAVQRIEMASAYPNSNVQVG